MPAVKTQEYTGQIKNTQKKAIGMLNDQNSDKWRALEQQMNSQPTGEVHYDNTDKTYEKMRQSLSPQKILINDTEVTQRINASVP